MSESIDRESGDIYDEAYFLKGRKSGKSLYENYRWLPELTIPMVEKIVEHCGINRTDTIIDFGCARGYVVKALRMLEYNAFGVDISKWAIDNADKETKPYLRLTGKGSPIVPEGADWIIAKDVLEHVPSIQLVIGTLMAATTKGLFVVVPLSRFDQGSYVIEDYEKDVTHIQRYNLSTWMEMFLRPGWRVEASYRLPGVKDNYYRKGWERGNGFITARRIEK